MDFLGIIKQLFDVAVDVLISFLPTSPFVPIIAKIKDIPYLNWLNWFIPVSAILQIMLLWLMAISTFYVYSVILRWAKVIAD